MKITPLRLAVASGALLSIPLALVATSGGDKAMAAARGSPAKHAQGLPRRPFHTMTELQPGDLLPLGAWPGGPRSNPLTTATLAITQVSVTGSGQLTLSQLIPPRGGNCAQPGAYVRWLGIYRVGPGEEMFEQSLPTPIVVRPMQRGRPYCLVASSEEGGGFVSVTGWVVSGKHYLSPVYLCPSCGPRKARD